MKQVSLLLLLSIFVLVSSLIALPANAELIGVSGGSFELNESPVGGVSAAIIPAPGDATDGGPSYLGMNWGMVGFDEVQDFPLTRNIAIDIDFGGVIPRGTRVDSHMILLNTDPEVDDLYEHYDVKWTFAGLILGVMSDPGGILEGASTDILGALGTTAYPAPFDARGLERFTLGNFDSYNLVSGNVLNVSMRAREPGDWIRVVTAAEPIPEPATMLLLGTGLVGLAGFRRKFRK